MSDLDALADAVAGVLSEQADQPDVLDRVHSALRNADEQLTPEEQDRLDGLLFDVLKAKLAAIGVDPDAQRASSVAELDAHGLPSPPSHLPVYREVYAGPRRTAQQVVDRIRALITLLEAVFSTSPPDDAGLELEDRGLKPYVSARELEWLRTRDQHLADQLSWRIEGLAALGWAIGIIDELPLKGQAAGGPEVFAGIDPNAEAGTPAIVELRDERDLLARLDVLYCAHWAVRNHQLTGQPEQWPGDVIGGVVWERRHALEWVLSDDEWDDIALDT